MNIRDMMMDVTIWQVMLEWDCCQEEGFQVLLEVELEQLQSDFLKGPNALWMNLSEMMYSKDRICNRTKKQKR